MRVECRVSIHLNASLLSRVPQASDRRAARRVCVEQRGRRAGAELRDHELCLGSASAALLPKGSRSRPQDLRLQEPFDDYPMQQQDHAAAAAGLRHRLQTLVPRRQKSGHSRRL